MLVDDDRVLQAMYASIFKAGNMKLIAQAYDGVEAVSMYQRLDPKPDAIIMDQAMPRMDGLTTTRKIREIDPSAKVIFISGDEKAEEKALKTGAQGFLLKPIHPGSLLALLNKIV